MISGRRTPTRNWKGGEKLLTEWLDKQGLWPATRTSTGARGEAVEDIDWGLFSVELKTRRTLPVYLFEWLKQASKNRNSKIPVVMAHQDHLPTGKQIVIMDLNWFIELLRKYEKENKQGGTGDDS